MPRVRSNELVATYRLKTSVTRPAIDTVNELNTYRWPRLQLNKVHLKLDPTFGRYKAGGSKWRRSNEDSTPVRRRPELIERIERIRNMLQAVVVGDR
jgi:hypothetical protein